MITGLCLICLIIDKTLGEGTIWKVFVDMSMEILGVSLAWWTDEEVCLRGLEVRGNYVWCLVIVIFMGLGGVKRWGGGF